MTDLLPPNATSSAADAPAIVADAPAPGVARTTSSGSSASPSAQAPAVTATGALPHIATATLEDIIEALKERGEPSFRAKQIWAWLYEKRCWDVNGWSNIPKSTRTLMQAAFSFHLPDVVDAVASDDGATKLLLQSKRGHRIEAVILRYDNRTSLCVSSQVGCKMACRFCQTGRLGFVRHLSADEIIGQFVLANAMLAAEDRRVTHVVFMGMGEPFDNYIPSLAAASSFVQRFGLSRRHVTLSTAGVVPKILSLANDLRCALAISLHAARDELRDELMPINRKYNLEELKAALIHYQEASGDIVTIEYILIRGKNTSQREARELVRFIHGLRAKVNLIPFNAHPGLDEYQRPDDAEIRAFQKYLADRSIPAPVRYSKGLDVAAACGQLAARDRNSLEGVPQRANLLPRAPQPVASK